MPGRRLPMHAIICRVQPSLLSQPPPGHHSRTTTSRQSTLHSRFPNKLLSHSIPSPVHSDLLFASSSAAALASAVAVELITSTVALKVSAASLTCRPGVAGTGGRASNQLLLKSKKHRSDQLHEVRKRMISRKLQYTHGLLRKYVQMKKRKMKAGEAFVGMKRRGSQLEQEYRSVRQTMGHGVGRDEAEGGGTTDLRRQNMAGYLVLRQGALRIGFDGW